MKTRRIIFIVLVGLMAVAGLFGWLGYRNLRQGDYNPRILALALAQADKRLLGEARALALEGDPLSNPSLIGLSVKTPSGEVMASADEVQIEFSLMGFLRDRTPVKVRLIGAYAELVKRGGVWNYQTLRKQGPPRTRPANYPPLKVMVEGENVVFRLSPSQERDLRASLPGFAGSVSTSGPRVFFKVDRLRGAVSDPPLGINDLIADGHAESLGPDGWAVRFKPSRAVTASSVIALESAEYLTRDSTFSAALASFEVAPDLLDLVSKSHPLAVPVEGSGSARGTTSEVDFSAVIHSEAGDLAADGHYSRPARQVEMAGTMQNFSLARFLVRPIQLSGMTGGFNLVYRSAVAPAAAPAGEAPDAASAVPPAELIETSFAADGQTAGPDNPADLAAALAQASGEPRYLKASLDLQTFEYPGLKSFPAAAEFELTGDAYAGAVFSEEPGANLAAYITGELAAPYPMLVRGVLRDLNPARLREGLPEASLAGIIGYDGEGKSIPTMRGSGQARLDPTTIYGRNIKDADIGYRMADGRLTFTSLAAVIDGISVNGTGWIEPATERKDFAADLDLKASGADAVSALTGGALAAESASATVKGRGSLKNWKADGTGKAAGLKTSAGAIASADFTLSVSAEGDRASGRARVIARQVDVPRASYKELKTPPLDVSLTVNLLPSPLSRPAALFEIDADSGGSDYSFAGAGKITIADASDWTMGLSSLSLGLDGRRWKTSGPSRLGAKSGGYWIEGFQLTSGGESVAVDGAVRDQYVNLSFGLDQVDLRPWTELLMPGDSIGGVASGSVVVKGAPSSPDITSSLSFANPRFRQSSLQSLEADLRYRSGRMTFALLGNADMIGRIKADGFIPVEVSISPGKAGLDRDGKMEMDLQAGEVSAAVFAGLLPGVRDIEGRVSVDARIRGTYANPEWNGEAEMYKVGLEAPQWGLRLNDINGRADIADNVVTFQNVTARAGEGTATLGGSLTLAGFSVSKMDLKVEASRFRAMNTPDIKAEIDGKVKLTGNLEAPRISGKIKFTELIYRPPLILDYQGTSWEKEDPTIRVKGEERPEVEPSPWLNRAFLNFDIEIPETGSLRNSELNIPFGGELTLRKPPGGFFLLFGKVEANEGWLTFQGRPFRVQRANFTFPAIPVIDPSMDILGSYRVPGYTTYVKIGGMLSQPTLEIYADPGMDQADVLSVILFGKPVSELAQGQKESLAARGGQLVAGYAAKELSQSLSDVLRLDALIIQPGGSLEESGVGFGKYLNERLYLFYYHNFGEEAAEEFRVRYEVQKNLYVEAGQDQTGQGGADVFFSYPY